MKDRRKFLKASVGILAGSLIVPKLSLASTEKSAGLPPLPWGNYEKLDPEYVRKLGHLGYYLFECAGGAFWAVMTALKEKVGEPYNMIPMPSVEEAIEALKEGEKERYVVPMQFGAGGTMGWATVCGSLIGCMSAMNFIMHPAKKPSKKIADKLFRYYETEHFPTEVANKYAAEHKFLVPKYKSDKVLPRSVSNSTLCHVSVSRWCLASGYPSGSKERSERCGRLTGDVAAMFVELMNAYVDGKLNTVATVTFSKQTSECRQCHSKKKTGFEKGHFSRGKMNCVSCHRDLRPHIAENKVRTAFGVDTETWVKASVIGAGAGVGAHVIARRLNRDGSNKEGGNENGEG